MEIEILQISDDENHTKTQKILFDVQDPEEIDQDKKS